MKVVNVLLIATVLVTLSVARDSALLKQEVNKRLAKKKCAGEIEVFENRIVKLEESYGKSKNDIVNHNRDLNTKIESVLGRANSFDAKITAVNEHADGVKTEIDAITALVTSVKDELMAQMKKLEPGQGQNHEEVKMLDKEMTPTDNIMPNGNVVGCYSMNGDVQPTESWKYQQPLQPTEQKDDMTSFHSVSGGNGGWSVIGQRRPSNEMGVGVIDLGAVYDLRKFVLFGWGAYMKNVELFAYTKDDTPNFGNPTTITEGSNWLSVGKLTNLPDGPRFPTVYSNPNVIDTKAFKSRYIKTQVLGSVIQVIAGIKAFGWKQ